MSVQSDRVEIRQSIIARARAVMRVIEIADLSLYHGLSWAEQLTLRMVQAHYVNRVRSLLAVMPPDLNAEILASAKVSGAVIGFSQN
jgi:hypothetical protein